MTKSNTILNLFKTENLISADSLLNIPESLISEALTSSNPSSVLQHYVTQTFSKLVNKSEYFAAKKDATVSILKHYGILIEPTNIKEDVLQSVSSIGFSLPDDLAKYIAEDIYPRFRQFCIDSDYSRGQFISVFDVLASLKTIFYLCHISPYKKFNGYKKSKHASYQDIRPQVSKDFINMMAGDKKWYPIRDFMIEQGYLSCDFHKVHNPIGMGVCYSYKFTDKLLQHTEYDVVTAKGKLPVSTFKISLDDTTFKIGRRTTKNFAHSLMKRVIGYRKRRLNDDYVLTSLPKSYTFVQQILLINKVASKELNIDNKLTRVLNLLPMDIVMMGLTNENFRHITDAFDCDANILNEVSDILNEFDSNVKKLHLNNIKAGKGRYDGILDSSAFKQLFQGVRDNILALDNALLNAQCASIRTQAYDFIDTVYGTKRDLKTCEFGGRIHSSFTRMGGTLKEFLLDEHNDALVELDIKACQMAAVSIITNNVCDYIIAEYKAPNSKYDDIKHCITYSKIKNYKKELSIFNKMVKDGSIYEYLGKKAGINSRSKAKVAVFTCIFGNSNNYSKTKFTSSAKTIYEAFEKEFPCIAEVMYIIKVHDYKAYVQKMQQFESRTLRKLLTVFNTDDTKITIHDAILTTSDVATRVSKELKKIVNECFNGIATLAIKQAA
jgi:hypothetical protein